MGFAVLKENSKNETEILKLGSRIILEDPDFHKKFYEGNPASKNASRRTKRGIRRGYDRLQARKEQLESILENYGMLPDEDLKNNLSAIELYGLRDRAVKEQISLQELGRVFIHLNQKRGFKSGRKSQSEEESNSDYLKRIEDLHKEVENQTIGSYYYSKLQADPWFRVKGHIFPRADYIKEFDKIWVTQQRFYPDVLSGGPGPIARNTLYHNIRNRTIFFQRRLKSAKHLISDCTFEKNRKTIPKSHPLFQVFKIWQYLNNLAAVALDGEVILLTDEQKKLVYAELHKKSTLKASSILKLIKLNKNEYNLNYEDVSGNSTFVRLFSEFDKLGLSHILDGFDNPDCIFSDDHPLVKLWHIFYSLESDAQVIKALEENFGIETEKGKILAQKIGFRPDYGSLSAKAIKKILPFLKDGIRYDSAVQKANYSHHSDIYKDGSKDKLELVPPNALRNPVVEQILNQVVNVVNSITLTYGKPDEIRIELARELKNNAKQRFNITQQNRKQKSEASNINATLQDELGFKTVTARDIQRFRLFKETKQCCLYCNRQISLKEVYDATTEIEHIIPKSRLFSNAHSNFILAHTSCNKAKGQLTAFDFMKSKSDDAFQTYLAQVDQLFKAKEISKSKKDFLLMAGDAIPDDFIDRQLKDSQYIAKETLEMLKKICNNVYSTSGQVTDFLKEKWNLKYLIEEINIPRYRENGLTEMKLGKDGNVKEVIKDWDKRKDHRHHALDALIIALTKQSHIQQLNNLAKNAESYSGLKMSGYDIKAPMDDLRIKAKTHLENVLISFKKPNSKVLTKKVNRVKMADDRKHKQETWVPRGSLHEDTVFGRIRRYKKSDWKDAVKNVEDIVDETVRMALVKKLEETGDIKKCLSDLNKNGLKVGELIIETPVMWDYVYTKRVPLSENLTTAQLSKIVDRKIADLVKERVETSGGIKQAFKDYEANPIYLDKAKRIPLKTLTVLDNSNLQKVRNGYVALKNNHHAIIYKDENGKFSDKVISFWEAVEVALHNLKTTGKIYPVIDTSPDPVLGTALMTLQINDLFLIDLPEELNLQSPKEKLAPYLYRLQKMSKSDYFFRHQYQTNLEIDLPFAMKRITGMSKFDKIIKVRLDTLGNIID